MRLLGLLTLVACAEWHGPATFPRGAAGNPVVSEQALVGLADNGDGAVAQLIDAEGAEPSLKLFAGETPLLTASGDVARAVAERVREAGHRATPVLSAAVSLEWPGAAVKAADAGYFARVPAFPEPGRRRFDIEGAEGAGALPLTLRVVDQGDAEVLLLEEIELLRVTLAGAAVAPEVWVQGDSAWLLAGSVLPGDPLHRAVTLRRASLSHAEAQLHNQHGLADYAGGDLDAARREFDRALAADPRFADALYNAAAAAALSDRLEDAVDLLKRAAAIDPERVQVLGRNDDDLRVLRKRPDVRALLGMKRPPPEDVPAPP